MRDYGTLICFDAFTPRVAESPLCPALLPPRLSHSPPRRAHGPLPVNQLAQPDRLRRAPLAAARLRLRLHPPLRAHRPALRGRAAGAPQPRLRRRALRRRAGLRGRDQSGGAVGAGEPARRHRKDRLRALQRHRERRARVPHHPGALVYLGAWRAHQVSRFSAQAKRLAVFASVFSLVLFLLVGSGDGFKWRWREADDGVRLAPVVAKARLAHSTPSRAPLYACASSLTRVALLAARSRLSSHRRAFSRRSPTCWAPPRPSAPATWA